MSEKEKLLTINVITDDDTGIYELGEVDGLFNTNQLWDYIESYGSTPLVNHLSILIHQVISVKHEINKVESAKRQGECREVKQ